MLSIAFLLVTNCALTSVSGEGLAHDLRAEPVIAAPNSEALRAGFADEETLSERGGNVVLRVNVRGYGANVKEKTIEEMRKTVQIDGAWGACGKFSLTLRDAGGSTVRKIVSDGSYIDTNDGYVWQSSVWHDSAVHPGWKYEEAFRSSIWPYYLICLHLFPMGERGIIGFNAWSRVHRIEEAPNPRSEPDGIQKVVAIAGAGTAEFTLGNNPRRIYRIVGRSRAQETADFVSIWGNFTPAAANYEIGKCFDGIVLFEDGYLALHSEISVGFSGSAIPRPEEFVISKQPDHKNVIRWEEEKDEDSSVLGSIAEWVKEFFE